MKKNIRLFFRRIYRGLKKNINKMGNEKQCYICKQTFSYFTKFRGGSKNFPLWFSKLKTVGSDVDNFGCMFCGSFDRERHLFMYFDKLNLWEQFRNAEIIHFAPEKILSAKIEQSYPLKYVKADLFPTDRSIKKIDLTSIPFADQSFNFVICNHVLEHVIDYKKALKEIYRVLKKNGIAILQTPFSQILHANFEDEGINSDELRNIYYGQQDHVRLFSEKQFISSLKEAGFDVQIIKHSEFFDQHAAKYFGVNSKEDLIRVSK